MRGRTFGLLAGAVFAVCLVANTDVLAVENAPAPDPGMVGITSTEENQGDQEAVRTRVAERKQNATTRLTAAEQRRTQARCKAAQAKVEPLRLKIDTFEAEKGRQYDGLANRLASLSTRLSGAADISQLSAQITELQSRVSSFKVATENYKLTLLDLALMDCTADPTGFRVTLESARKARQDLVQELQSTATFLNQTLKPNVQALQLKMKNGANDGA